MSARGVVYPRSDADPSKPAKSKESQVRVVANFVERIGRCAVEANPSDREKFELQMKAYAESLRGPRVTPDDVSAACEASLLAFEEYSGHTGKLIREGNQNMQTMLLLMTSSLSEACLASARVIDQFQALERRLEQVVHMVDVPDVRDQLESCLFALKAERTDHEAVHSAQVKDRDGLVATPAVRQAISEQRVGIDPTTGLPGLSRALDAINHALRSGEPYAFAMAVVERWETVVKRLGPTVGDELLRVSSRDVAEALGEGAHLYRWRGPCVVALIPGGTIRGVGSCLSPLSSRRIFEVQIGGREALLSLSISWKVSLLKEFTSIVAACQAADSFLAHHHD